MSKEGNQVTPDFNVASMLAKYANYMYKDEAYSRHESCISGDTLVRSFTGVAGGNTENFAAIYKSGSQANTYIIAFKGTATKMDAFEDALVGSREFYPYKDAWAKHDMQWQIHDGFYNIYSSFQSGIMSWIDANKGNIDLLYVTGHSLGGALSTIFTYDNYQSFGHPFRIVHYNFASPMVGGTGVTDGGFVAKYNELDNNQTIRIVNTRDLVPCLPGGILNYGHIGNYYDLNFALSEYRYSGALDPGVLKLAKIFLDIVTINPSMAAGDILRILANHSMDNYEHVISRQGSTWTWEGHAMVSW